MQLMRFRPVFTETMKYTADLLIIPLLLIAEYLSNIPSPGPSNLDLVKLS